MIGRQIRNRATTDVEKIDRWICGRVCDQTEPHECAEAALPLLIPVKPRGMAKSVAVILLDQVNRDVLAIHLGCSDTQPTLRVDTGERFQEAWRRSVEAVPHRNETLDQILIKTFD